jgi:hypothetical protein
VLSPFRNFIESLATRLLQRVGVEVLRHADAVCVQARARRDLETLDLAKELEARGAQGLAKDLRARVLAEDQLRLPALAAEVEQMLLPAADTTPAAAGAGPSLPLPLPPGRLRRPRRPVRLGTAAKNGQPDSPPIPVEEAP